MHKYKLIGFDMDGTLCHPITEFEHVFKQAFGIDQATVRTAWMNAIMAEKARTGIESIQAIFPELNQQKAEALLQKFSQMWAGQQKLFDGVISMLMRLREQGYKLTLITNGPSVMQHTVIDHLGIRHLFDHAFTTGDDIIGINKPNRACFDKVAKIFSLDANQCLFIGDGQINDYKGAQSAGWDAIWVAPQNNKNTQKFSDLEVISPQETAYPIRWV